jgi:putative transposase
MPWKETQKMDQRIEFALKAVNCESFSELCAEYGISRKTGYKWRERFVTGGIEGMEEESRRPHRHSASLEEPVVCRIVRLKHAHQHWGPRKIRELYARQHPGVSLPSESSFKRVLERAGLTERRKRRRVQEQGGRLCSGRKASAPNEVWTVDFKGWWRSAAEGERVDPLTVRDEYSRMVLAFECTPDARGETVRACFEKLFEAHGLPNAIRSDNGTPFATARGLLGLSRLSAWWLALGIDLERSRPGCPQDNGAHERLHLDIRRELEAGRIGRDQAAFDLWRRQYNTERPHEALAMAVPADISRPSEREYEGTPDQLDYAAMETRRVAQSGNIGYRRDYIRISTALSGWDVGLAPRQDGVVEVWFTRLLLGHIDPQTSSFSPIKATRNPEPPGADRSFDRLRYAPPAKGPAPQQKRDQPTHNL